MGQSRIDEAEEAILHLVQVGAPGTEVISVVTGIIRQWQSFPHRTGSRADYTRDLRALADRLDGGALKARTKDFAEALDVAARAARMAAIGAE